MAAAVLRDIGRQLDAAMSSCHSSVRSEHLVCFDRLAKLHIQTGSRGSIVALEVVHDTKLVLNLGKLLGLALEHHSNPRTRWEDLNYCKLVGKSVAAMIVVFVMADSSIGQPYGKEDPVFAWQLAASELLQKLVAALPGLTEAVEAATERHPCIEVAVGGLLSVTITIFGIWPGRLGVLSSTAAGPLVQPALRLLVALFRYAAATDDAAAFEIIVSNSMAGISKLAQLVQADRASDDQDQQRQMLPDHPHLKELRKCPAFLLSLLTTSCIILHSGSTATAAALAAKLRAADSGRAHVAAPADKHDRCDHSDGHCARPLIADSEHGDQHTGVTGKASSTAVPQQQAALQMQLVQVLQDIYGQSDTAGSWHRLLSGDSLARNTGWHYVGALQQVLSAAARCMQELKAELQHAASAAASMVDVHSSNEPHQACLSLQHHLPSLHALRKLAVLLPRGLCSAPAQAATRTASAYWLHRAAISLVKEVLQGWKLQLELQSSCVGVQVEHLPCSDLLKQLLQQLNVLQKLRSEAAAALAAAQLTADAARSSQGASAAAADTESAAAVGARWVNGLDLAMIELLDVLVLLQPVSPSGVWQPHLQEVAAALEHCARNTGSGTNDPAAPFLLHHYLCMSCDRFLWQGGKEYQFADSMKYAEGQEPGPMLQAAAASAPGSQLQQQLLTLLISLLKSSSCLQHRTLAKHVLGYPQLLAASCRVVSNVMTHMLNTLWCGNRSNPSTAAAEMLHDKPGSQLLCAAAPWLVASSKLVCHMATQLADCLEILEEQLHATAADAPSSSSKTGVGAQGGLSIDAAQQVEAEHVRLTAYCNASVLSFAGQWVEALEHCCSLLQESSECTDGSSSSGSDRDVDAVCDADTSVMTAAAPPPSEAAETMLAAVHNAAQDLQQAELQEVCRVLDNGQWMVGPPGLVELQQVASCATFPQLQPHTELGEHDECNVSASAAAGSSQAVLDVGLFKKVMASYGVRQLLQEVVDAGLRVCAAFPVKSCCNNPVCSNVSSSSERVLVSGKRCVCAGCEAARYCGRECQVAHWPWHKAICKAIKKQSRAKQHG